MITYTTNQRRSLRYTAGGDWIEEVLAASGVEVSDTNFDAIAGTDIQTVLDSIDNVLDGISATPASGVLIIEDVANVSGITSDTLQNLDVITMGSGSNSQFRFSFGVPAQPADPVHLRFLIAPRGSTSGVFSGTLEYNLFDQGDDLTNGSYTYTGSVSQSLTAGDFETLKLVNITIPLVNFSSGTAPFIVDCKFTRDVSVGGNYGADISLVQLYADNIPGAATGNQAGYVGGNLTVDGDLTVEGYLILQGGSEPASGTAAGVSGSFVIADNFIYAATSTNTWKRTPINSF